MSRKIYLIYSDSVNDQVATLDQHELISKQGVDLRKVKLGDLKSIHVDEQFNHAIAWIEQKDYSSLLLFAQQKKLSLGFLPIKGQKSSQFYKSLGLNEDFDDCLQIALQAEPISIDLILCNGEVVSDGIELENQTTMAEFLGDSQLYSGWKKLLFKYKRLIHAFSLTPHPITVVTAKGKNIATAITGMALLDFQQYGTFSKLYKDSISLTDGRISVLLLAPQSILSYLQFSVSTLLTTTSKTLPQQLGYIRTRSLSLKTPIDTHYLINGHIVSTRELTIDNLSAAIKVAVSDTFKETQQYSDDKENVICHQLPQQENRIKYLAESLPFFPHAEEADFKDLFLALKDNARLHNSFVLLMILSSLLATLGLFLNSPSVVIGAMVLAPLMAPIISFSMGLLRSDSSLSRQSAATLSTGILIALGLSALLAALLPFQDVTNEIAGRLHPTTLDLCVAVLSGIAGAFANARENIAKSLPGVAIAVALVPPLCVSGIGIGWLNLEIFYGAMLLFLTNLTGIIMAAGLSFMVIGFAPIARAKKGLLLSILMVSIISVPLFISFAKMQERALVKKQLGNQTFSIAGNKLLLRNISVRMTAPIKITAELMTNAMPDAVIIHQIEQSISQQLAQKALIELKIRLVSDRYFTETLNIAQNQ